MLSVATQQALKDTTLTRAKLDAELDVLLQRINATRENHEQLGGVVVTGDAGTVDNGLLTPTLKIKRVAIERRYLPRAGVWLAQGRPVVREAG